MKHNFFVVILVLLTINLLGQINPTATGSKSNAKAQFELENYKYALDEYLVLLKKDNWDESSRYRVAVCYLNLYQDKTKALPLLSGLLKADDERAQLWYDVGRAYQYSNMFEEAIMCFDMYNQLCEKLKQTDPNSISAKRRIEMINNATELMKTPVNVSFKNMGKQFNTVFPEFNPYVSNDGLLMVFTSQNDKCTGQVLDYDGFFSADVYMSTFLNGAWQKPKSPGTSFNTEYSEHARGLSNNGKDLFVVFDNEDYANELLLANKSEKAKSFPKPVKVFNWFGSEDVIYAATITADKSTIIFSVKTKGNKTTGKDLYVTYKDEFGKWKPKQLLSPVINTMYDEDFPVLAPDGKTMYFSSAGHYSIGDRDIFKTVYDSVQKEWSTPVNLGYPINTLWDDDLITFVANGRFGYMARVEKEGLGDRDIYQVVLNDVPPARVHCKGTILNQENLNIYKTDLKKLYLSNPGKNIRKVEVSIRFKNTKSGEEFGPIIPDLQTGAYSIHLLPGTYQVEFTAPGFNAKPTELVVPDLPIMSPESVKNFVLPLNTK